MAFNLPPPPVSNDPSDPSFRDWFYKLKQAFGSLLFTDLDFTGSNITSIATRNHADLQNLNTASYTHLTATNATDLTDAGDTTLHFHSADRDLANATGTLLAVNGGTGFSSYTVGDIIYAGTTTTFSKLSDVATGNALISGGVGVAPSWGKIGLATHVSGNLPVTNLNSGTSASGATFWRGDGTWATPTTGSGITTVQDEGTPLTLRDTINFIGAGVTAVDDAGNSRTNITISGGGGGGSSTGSDIYLKINFQGF